MSRILFRCFVAFVLSLQLAGSALAAGVPNHVYLTWRLPDTSTTMTVNFHTDINVSAVTVHYDTVAQGGDPSKYRGRAQGDSVAITELKRRVHSIDLKGLMPNTTYYFTVSGGARALSPEKSFRTIPNDASPINFVVGGDMGNTREMLRLNQQAARHNPMFAVLGGDITYDNGKLSNYDKWDDWLAAWDQQMRTSDGRMVPLVLAIGNHEVQGGYGGKWDGATFYKFYFAQEPKRTYFSRQFGKNMIFYILDSGHVAPHNGAQAEWLRAEMQRTASIPNKFAAYHVPLYPSVRSYNEKLSEAGRTFWGPSFDQYNLTVGFEHHDHALKRTKPMTGGKIVPNGTIFLGDGCWGRGARGADEKRPYLAHAEDTNHFWSVRATPTQLQFIAVDAQGGVRDSMTLTPGR